jgi:hypothetical protein
MAALFAVGIMSVTWMALTAALIAIEKILPWRQLATYGVAAVLLVLGLLLLVHPAAVPALTIPSHDSMHSMNGMLSLPAALALSA